MPATILDIPDEVADVGPWLDALLVGEDLGRVMAELAAVHGVALPSGSPGSGSWPTPADATAWLGDRLPAVLAGGFGQLDSRVVGELLRNPALLPALQEVVCSTGGSYWMDLARGTAPAGRSPQEFSRLMFADDSRSGLPVLPGPAGSSTSSPLLVRTIAALAACLLVAVGIWSLSDRGGFSERPWGWSVATALDSAPADRYLDQLAAAGEQWFAVKPDSEAALAKRLEQMIAGCDRLIEAAHEPLAPEDREWLREKCRAWREKFVGQLEALAASHDVAAGRAAADETVTKLVVALRSRATEVRGRRPGAA
jgi:hypothetical protein